VVPKPRKGNDKAQALLAATSGARPLGAVVPKVPTGGLVLIGSGVQSSSDRNQRKKKGRGSEISTEGKEDSSTST
jgi:hypothetical protein